MQKKELARIAFECLGRHFPNKSGKDTPELRAAFNIPVGTSPSNAQWKKGACDWLAENVVVELPAPVAPARKPAAKKKKVIGKKKAAIFGV